MAEQKTILNDLSMLELFIRRGIDQCVQDRGLPYGEGFSQYARENPALFKLREVLRRREEVGAPDVQTYRVIEGQLVKVENDISGLIAQVRAEHPDLTYGEAMKVTLSEHQDLWRRREELRDQLQR